MKKLIFRSILFILPFGVLFILSVGILFKTGEIFGINKAVQQIKKQTPTTLFGLAYSYPVKYYKSEAAQLTNPEILVLGSSRTMQIRSKFINPTKTFYNAGGAVNKIRFFRLFLQNMEKDKLPEFVVIGVDQWWFNEKWDDLTTNQFDIDIKKPANDIRIILASWKDIYFDFFKGKIDFTKIFDQDSINRIGLSALMQNQGFRNDGSYFYGNFNYENTLEENIVEELKMFEDKRSWFLPCETINQKAVEELDMFLQFCQDNGIEVVGFLPPYAESIYNNMMKEKELYPNVFDLEATLRPFFDKRKFGFFNFDQIKKVSSSDMEMLDGTHGSEKLYLRIVLHMAEKDTVFSKYVNKDLLYRSLETSDSNIDVFNFNF